MIPVVPRSVDVIVSCSCNVNYLKSSSDQNRPTCSQCQTSPRSCHYQQGGKRGLPAAYMASLEERLQDTEIALDAALRSVTDQRGQGIVYYHLDTARNLAPAFQYSKAEKQRSWRQQPLRTSEDIVAWFEARQVNGHNATSPHSPKIDQVQDGAHSASTVEDAHLPTRGPSPIAYPSDAMTKLRSCKRPLTPNVPYNSARSTEWLDRYF